jgi:hypothetical protein
MDLASFTAGLLPPVPARLRLLEGRDTISGEADGNEAFYFFEKSDVKDPSAPRT